MILKAHVHGQVVHVAIKYHEAHSSGYPGKSNPANQFFFQIHIGDPERNSHKGQI